MVRKNKRKGKREAIGFYTKDGKARPITAPSGTRRGRSTKPTKLALSRERIEGLRADPQRQAEEGIFIDPFGEPYRIRKRGNWVHAVALDGRVLASVNTKTGKIRGDVDRHGVLERAYEEETGSSLSRPRRAKARDDDTGKCMLCGREGAPWQPQAGTYAHHGCLDMVL